MSSVESSSVWIVEYRRDNHVVGIVIRADGVARNVRVERSTGGTFTFIITTTSILSQCS